jgi:hypothetical protein
MADQIDFFQIYYKEEQRSNLYQFATPYFNDTLTPFFENSVISDLVLRSQADKIAVCSWILREKIANRIPPRPELTEERIHDDFDVMSFTKNTPSHDMLGALEVWHPGAVDILKRIWSELGYEMPKKVKYPIYQNAFCASSEVYTDYVINFLIPAMYLMEFDKEIRELCYQNANYTVSILGKKVDFDRIEKFLGIRYYPMHPFLLERCFSLWIQNRNLKVVYL